MRGWIAYSLSAHVILLLAAFGYAMPFREVSMPRVAAVSITGAATPPAIPELAPQELPVPVVATPTEIPKPEPGELYVPPEVIPDPEPNPELAPPESPAVRMPPREHVVPELRKPEPVHPEPPPAEPQPDRAPVSIATPGPVSAKPSTVDPADSLQCDVAPRLTEVQWPRTLRRRFQGTVVVRVELDRAGALKSLQIVAGTGRKEWDDALLDAMRAARYQPAVKANTPVACRHTFRIEFVNE